MHPSLLALPEHERPLDGETANDYWLRLQAQPPTPRGPRLLTEQTMTPFQRQQYKARLRGGMHCWDALHAVTQLEP